MSQDVLFNWFRFAALAAVATISVFLFWPKQEGQILDLNLGLDLRGGCMIMVQIKPLEGSEVTPEKMQQLLSQTIVVLENRVNGLGLTEPTISSAGTDRVLIQLPGEQQSDLCNQITNIRGILEFKKVLKSTSVTDELKTDNINQEVLKGRECFDQKLKDQCQEYLVEREPLLRGDALEAGKAKVQVTQVTPQNPNPIMVELNMNVEGGKGFSQALVKVGPNNVNDYKRLAIVLDNQVYSAPGITPDLYNDARNGRSIRQAVITGQFTNEQAKLLASVLNAGALPTAIEVIQNATVGPSLGKDSIEKGLNATLLAALFIMLFMVFYYRLSGLIADFTMVLNIVVLLGALAILDATLTLPGIAGIILTIGIGVDSNVLIFERMREELKTGKQARAAIDAGYDRALMTIIDSHVTTLLTGLILFVLGTGPIRGFAITLCLGITINLFTALVGTKMIYEFLKLRRIQKLSI
jgi:preprotein translocase subunit SecD